jgi:hypothetical protein
MIFGPTGIVVMPSSDTRRDETAIVVPTLRPPDLTARPTASPAAIPDRDSDLPAAAHVGPDSQAIVGARPLGASAPDGHEGEPHGVGLQWVHRLVDDKD